MQMLWCSKIKSCVGDIMFGFPSDSEKVMAKLSDGHVKFTFWCRIGFHTWLPWNVDKEGISTNKQIRFKEISRQCEYCKFPMMRTVWEREIKR